MAKDELVEASDPAIVAIEMAQKKGAPGTVIPSIESRATGRMKDLNSGYNKPFAEEKKAKEALEKASSQLITNQPQHKPTDIYERERTRAQYDVYAKPFVPSELQAICHELPSVSYSTSSKHRIDYPTYTDSFAGRIFVPARAVIPKELANPYPPKEILPLAPKTYLEHFLILRNIEYGAKELENRGHTIYKEPFFPVLANDIELYRLSVPGLREGSPLIEIGDTLQLRQLWLDGYGNLASFSVPNASTIRQSWNKVELNSCVYSIDRAQEVVYLKIEGLVPGSMVFNVMLPLNQRMMAAQWHGLAFVHQQLEVLSNGHSVTSGTNNTVHELSQGVVNMTIRTAGHEVQSPWSSPQRSSKDQHPYKKNDWIRRMLFPVEEDGVIQTKLRGLPLQGLFDPVIDFEQLQAVNSSTKQKYGVLPFLISGPPGTGKTKTLVEIAMQLLERTDIAHILIVAPSESAADTLALRLRRYLNPQQMLRLNGPWRADNEIPKELLPYCYMEREMFYLPPFPQLMKYNIVVTSTRDTSILADARVTNSDLYHLETNMQKAFHPENYQAPKALHWGALLMDEAAQSTETDTLPALSVVCPPTEYPPNLEQPRFIMAGDQHQLGPRTASHHPLYALSLFERLFERSIYANHPLSRSDVCPTAGPPILTAKMLPILYPPFVNLYRNYRSHPAILSIPSSLFYNDTLIPEAPAQSTPLQHSSLWTDRKWPVLFIPHYGPDDNERDGGGWYNTSEKRVACDLAQRFVTESKVAQRDIAIISPFAAQVKKIRAEMRSSRYGGGSGLWDVNIGPLEAFQGLESRVVIICTTRTRGKYVDLDIERGLGIIGQKRKMNVALTRAREALVVIGNPAVLSRDQYWRTWMAFCQRNGLVQGKMQQNLGVEESDHERARALEKALVAKEEMKKMQEKGGRALGSASTQQFEDEMWAAGFRSVLEEYGDVTDDEDEEEEEQGLDE